MVSSDDAPLGRLHESSIGRRLDMIKRGDAVDGHPVGADYAKVQIESGNGLLCDGPHHFVAPVSD